MSKRNRRKYFSNNADTVWEREKRFKKRLTGDFDDIMNNCLEVESDREECEKESVHSEEITHNSWVERGGGGNIDIKVRNSTVDIEGDRENAH